MHRTNVILAATATGVIVGLGVLARISPEFKAAATNLSLTALVALVLIGLLGALIAPLLDHWTDTGPSLRDDGSDPPGESVSDRPAPPIRSIR
jgi:hypothetical protein